MRTRPKDLGTRFESFIVTEAQRAGLIAERLAEGGQLDRGDIRIYTDSEWVVEAKDRMNLNVPRELEKALAKSGTSNTALAWRKMIRRDGNQNRSQDGPIIVAITLDRYFELLRTEVS